MNGAEAPPAGRCLLQEVVDGQQAEVFIAAVVDRREDWLLEADHPVDVQTDLAVVLEQLLDPVAVADVSES